MAPAAPLAGTEQVEVSQDISGTLQSRRLALTDLKDWLEKKNNLSASTDPGPNDDSSAGYQVGSKWKNGQEWWICSDAAEGAAHWEPTTLSADELGTAALAEVGQFLQVANNGSDIADPAAFRAALSLGSAALAVLAAGGGTVPETNRANVFTGDQTVNSGNIVASSGNLVVNRNRGVSVDYQDNGGSFVIRNTDAVIMTMFNYGNVWADYVRSGFFQFGAPSALFTGYNGASLSRFGIATQGLTVADTVSSDLPAPEATLDVRGVVLFGAFTVATLPSTPAEGSRAYASDGLKSSETTGSGTGVPVYYSNGSWRVQGADTPVQA